MAVFKCKICGGDLEINPGDTIAVCEYCGTKQTLPKLDTDRKINLFERANQFRRNNEYDKAMGLYEQILHDDISDAETYWSLVLCKYGIEYVEDPSSHKWIPTVNRVQYTPVIADTDYKSAIQCADETQRQIYEDEAKKIDKIQKDILEVAAKEDPYDIFICYKQTDDKGRRTPDSVLANDLYYLLTDEGYKVFFSQITLEDKLGTEYEPYIFNALNSSKIMLVLGTKPKYFNAVWVKNEWSRFMKLMENDRTRMLVPCYRDMDPYDLPEEFAHLQAQDMSKLGFSQDIIRGIKKILDPTIPNETIIIQESSTDDQKTIDLSVKKLFLSLEEEDWQSAEEYCEKILDLDPENAQAYLGRLMVDLKVPDPVSLKNSKTDFEDNLNYKRALRYSDDELKAKLEEYNSEVKNRLEHKDYEEYYQKNLAAMKRANTENDWAVLAAAFARIPDYKDSNEMRKKCLESEDNSRVKRLFNQASKLKDSESIESLKSALECYNLISDKMDVTEQITFCQNKINKIIEEETKKQKKENYIGILQRTACIVLGAILGIIALTVQLMGSDNAGTAISVISSLLIIIGPFFLFQKKAGTTDKTIGMCGCCVFFFEGIIMYFINQENGYIFLSASFVGFIVTLISFLVHRNKKEHKSIKKANKEPKHVDVITPINSSNLKSKNYMWVKNVFQNNGFSNIILSEINDVKLGIFTQEGSVEKVSINGDSSFRKGKKYNPNVPVVITYHAKK